MKTLSAYLFSLVVTCAAILMLAPLSLHRSRSAADNVKNQTNAAFRDGLFLARLDAESGRKPHLMSGRWSSDEDRRLFVAAYLQAYRERRGDVGGKMELSQPAAERGFRDGLADGLQRRHESRSFQPMATENYRRADRGYSDNSDGLKQYKQAYREAYCNAYQLAFYGEPQEVQTATVLRRML